MDKDTLEYIPVSVRRANWPDDEALITQLRNTAAEAIDHTSLHYLALLGGEPAGYLRLQADGTLDTLTSRPEYRNDIDAALLRFAVQDGPTQHFARLHATRTFSRHDLLPALGFEPDNTQTGNWQLLLPPGRQTTEHASELMRLDSIGGFRDFSLALLQQARRSIQIYSEDLEPWLYDNDTFVAALMAFIQTSRNTQVRIMVRDTRALLQNGHRLLTASQRAGEKILIRTLPSCDHGREPCYLVTDDSGLLFRSDPAVINGAGYRCYRARIKPLLAQFDELWNRAYSDPALRQLSL